MGLCSCPDLGPRKQTFSRFSEFSTQSNRHLECHSFCLFPLCCHTHVKHTLEENNNVNVNVYSIMRITIGKEAVFTSVGV